AARLGSEEARVPFLRPALQSIDKHVDDAIAAFSISNPSACAPPLLAALDELNQLMNRVSGSQLSPAAKEDLRTEVGTKIWQAEEAANEAMGIFFEATVDPPGPPPGPSYFPRMEQTMSLAVPGQTFTLTARIYNRGKVALKLSEIDLHQRGLNKDDVIKKDDREIAPGEMAATQFQVSVPDNAQYTRPYFVRHDQEKETVYTLIKPAWATLPFAPYPIAVSAKFASAGRNSQVGDVAKIKFVDPALGQSERPLAVGPPISVLLTSPVIVAPVGAPKQSEVEVNIRSNVQTPVHATLRLETPPGWKVSPA